MPRLTGNKMTRAPSEYVPIDPGYYDRTGRCPLTCPTPGDYGSHDHHPDRPGSVILDFVDLESETMRTVVDDLTDYQVGKLRRKALDGNPRAQQAMVMASKARRC